MRATIRDPEALQAVPPPALAAYLRNRGWHQVEQVGDKASVWSRTVEEAGELEILMPLRRDLRDFPQRMAEVLGTLEVAERRAQSEILDDITAAAFDVLRIRLLGEQFEDGTMPLEQGVRAVERTRDLVLAAACAAVSPRPVYYTRKPPQATEYAARVRLGQTAHGSYVLTVRSPVPPGLAFGLDVEDPFERRVTKTLARALLATRNASLDALATGSLDAFRQAIALGVSANLCDAVAGLAGDMGARGVDFNLSWSAGREIHGDVPSSVVIDADSVQIIEEAGRLFRETAPQEDFEIQGFVVRLDRSEGAETGIATVTTPFEGGFRNVRLTLGGDEYDLAVTAHANRRRVRALGVLAREGRSYVLRNPHGIEVEPEAEEIPF